MEDLPNGRLEGELSLRNFRKRVSAFQLTLLDTCWKHYCETGKWLSMRRIHSAFERNKVIDAFRQLGGSVIWETSSGGVPEYQLSLLGALLTSKGEESQKLLIGFFDFQRSMFLKDPENNQATATEIASYLKLSEPQVLAMGHVLKIASLIHSEGPNWTTSSMREADTFPKTGCLNVFVEQWAFRYFNPDAPVLQADRRNDVSPENSLYGLSSLNFPFGQSYELPRVKSGESDPLKRRYQVFVSSTHNDLIEERKHIMQALLMTKCIPSGMELFPAASVEQWKLIQQVIDDCDYYVVVVAGKYGSIGSNGKSYTEMEFDYAVSRNKPILGFYHSDIQKLAGEKLEQNDSKRKALDKFTQKVKSKMCHDWNSSEGLASAIKTAIYHAIETNPKPGWIRADSVPTWPMVKNLEARIAELEGRTKSEKRDVFPNGEDYVEIPMKVRWKEVDANHSGWTTSLDEVVFDEVFKLTWDEVLQHIALKPGESTNRLGMLRHFTHSLANTLEKRIHQQAKKRVIGIDGAMDSNQFDEILQTFLARKMLRQTKPPKHVNRKSLYWQLAPKGIQRIAELRAVRG